MKTGAKCRALRDGDNVLNEDLMLKVNVVLHPSLPFFRYGSQEGLNIVDFARMANLKAWSRTLMECLIGHHLRARPALST